VQVTTRPILFRSRGRPESGTGGPRKCAAGPTGTRTLRGVEPARQKPSSRYCAQEEAGCFAGTGGHGMFQHDDTGVLIFKTNKIHPRPLLFVVVTAEVLASHPRTTASRWGFSLLCLMTCFWLRYDGRYLEDNSCQKARIGRVVYTTRILLYTDVSCPFVPTARYCSVANVITDVLHLLLLWGTCGTYMIATSTYNNDELSNIIGPLLLWRHVLQTWLLLALVRDMGQRPHTKDSISITVYIGLRKY
jgi:hypothetical protein